MAIFEGFPAAAFNNVKIPVSRVSVRGGIRKHTHVFPHSAGGEQEKLGRELYRIRMEAHFHDLPGTDFADRFPDCYPDSLLQLRKFGEQQLTADLVIPSIGTIKAFLVNWEQVADFAQALSGEEVTLEFEEDQASAFLTSTMFEFGANGLASKGSTLSAQAALADYFGQPQPSIFDDINNAIEAVQGVIGLGDAYANLVAAKLEQVANLCSEADRDVDAIQQPANYVLLDALKDVWEAAVELQQDVTQSGASIQTYKVPKLMAIGEVSTNIYGDASHAVDLMKLNPIEDAYEIPAGTAIRYLNAA